MDFYKWIFMLAVFVMIALAGCVQDKAGNLSNSQVDHIQISDAYFPLSEGAYWIYQGTVTWEDAGEVKSESLEWMMEVIDVIDRGDVVGYRMLGHPGDLAWYEIGKKPSEYAIIRAGSGSYYITITCFFYICRQVIASSKPCNGFSSGFAVQWFIINLLAMDPILHLSE